MNIFKLEPADLYFASGLDSYISFIYDPAQEKLIHICQRLVENEEYGLYFLGDEVGFDYAGILGYYCLRCQEEFEFAETAGWKTGFEGSA